MIRVAFAADLHVDTYGQRIDPDTRTNARLEDFLRSLRWVADTATAEGCDLLVIAGDFTERYHAPPWLVDRIEEALQPGPLHRVYVRGNHDRGDVAGRSIVDVLGRRVGVAVAGVDPLNAVVSGVRVVALPFADRQFVRSLGQPHELDTDVRQYVARQLVGIARGYAVHSAQVDPPGRPRILVLHQSLAGGVMGGGQVAYGGSDDTVVDAEALSTAGYDLVIAGHFHRHQVVPTSGAPVIYPGSIDRVDFGEEGEPKGFVIAEFHGAPDLPPGPAPAMSQPLIGWRFVQNPHAREYLTLRADMPSSPDVQGKIVRAIDLPPGSDTVRLRQLLEDRGAWEVQAVTTVNVDRPDDQAIAESLTPTDAVGAYFADHPDRTALVDLASELLQEAST